LVEQASTATARITTIRSEQEALRLELETVKQDLGAKARNAESALADREREVESLRKTVDQVKVSAAEELDRERKGRVAAEEALRTRLAELKSALDLIRDDELHKIYPDLRPLNGNLVEVNENT
jgi:phosphoenolpyruvate-protein kinase (PTS system EI component)